MLTGFILIPLPIIAVISAIIYLMISLHQKKRVGKQPFSYHFCRYVFTGYLVSLIYLTILWYYPYLTFHPECYSLNLVPFIWITEVYDMGPAKMAEQLILNIGMFFPYGILLPIIVPKARKLWATLSIVLLTTLSIETLQYFMGRSADVDDVIMNFAGGLIGYLIYFLCNQIYIRSKHAK